MNEKHLQPWLGGAKISQLMNIARYFRYDIVLNFQPPKHQGGLIRRTKMKKIILFVLAILIAMTSVSYAGNCDYSWQTASDGARCGRRAASERPGGRL